MFKVLLLILLLCCLLAVGVLAGAHLNLHPLPSNSTADRVLVEKSIRRLSLLRNGTLLKTYRVALGRAPVGPKEQEGDQRTPEGIYQIDFHKEDSDYHRALHVSYPEQRDIDHDSRPSQRKGLDRSLSPANRLDRRLHCRH
jgi:hypothetical protein